MASERKCSERKVGGAAATHRKPLRTHSRSGLALSRRHQGHCNEKEGQNRKQKEEGEGRKMKMRGSRQRECDCTKEEISLC